MQRVRCKIWTNAPTERQNNVSIVVPQSSRIRKSRSFRHLQIVMYYSGWYISRASIFVSEVDGRQSGVRHYFVHPSRACFVWIICPISKRVAAILSRVDPGSKSQRIEIHLGGQSPQSGLIRSYDSNDAAGVPNIPQTTQV